jgi:integrase
VFFDELPKDIEKDTNYLLVKGNKISMSLNDFKNRNKLNNKTRERKELLKPWNVKELPEPLTNLIKMYISKKIPAMKSGDYLFTATQGKTIGQVYSDDTYSSYVRRCCKKVLDLNMSNNDFRHYHNTTHVKWNEMTQNERQDLAEAMGDVKVETAMNYIVPSLNKAKNNEVLVENDIDIDEVKSAEADEEPLDEMFKMCGMMLIEFVSYSMRLYKRMQV